MNAPRAKPRTESDSPGWRQSGALVPAGKLGGVVEEASQAGINAGLLGGPVEIPAEMRAAALQRAMTFDSRGTVRV